MPYDPLLNLINHSLGLFVVVFSISGLFVLSIFATRYVLLGVQTRDTTSITAGISLMGIVIMILISIGKTLS